MHASWPRRFPLVQFPNLPLMLGLVGSLVARVADGDVHDYAYAAASVGYAAWAWLELAQGVNWFRRLLGLAGVVWVVVRLAT